MSRRRPCHADGFTLLETALALLILMLGTGLVIAGAVRLKHRHGRAVLLEDLRTIATVFQDYQKEHKVWPASSCTDVALPADLALALARTDWGKGSPFGGHYGWIAPAPAETRSARPDRGWSGRGAVTLTAFSPDFPLELDLSDLLQIDRQLDDGNLRTGRFRTGFNGWPVYLVEAAPR